MVKWGLECVWTNKCIEERLAGLSLTGDVWVYEPKEETSDHEKAPKGHENDEKDKDDTCAC